MCICIYIYIYVYTHNVYIYIYICIHIMYIFVYIYIYIYRNICISIDLSIYLSIYLSLYIYIYIYIYIYPSSRIRPRENMVGVNMVLAWWTFIPHDLYSICLNSIHMLAPCLLQPCFHVAGHRLPDGVGRNGVFTEGPQIPLLLLILLLLLLLLLLYNTILYNTILYYTILYYTILYYIIIIIIILITATPTMFSRRRRIWRAAGPAVPSYKQLLLYHYY